MQRAFLFVTRSIERRKMGKLSKKLSIYVE